MLTLVFAGCGGGVSETCTPPTACTTSTKTYKLCTHSSGSSCRYLTSDGTVFSCGSCADCQAATTQVVSWCSGGADDGGSSGACLTQSVCANSALDCSPGQRCNTALSPPVCQALYCGANGTLCGGDSANDLCASRVCSGGACGGGGSGSCCQFAHQGNELGVGQYCSPSSDCSNNRVATLCSGVGTSSGVGFCTTLCQSGSTTCGTNATCQCAGTSTCACVPTNCTITGCH